MSDEQHDRCGRCGAVKADHALVNYADGPSVGAAVLLCPRGTYRDPAETPEADDPELMRLMLDTEAK